MGRIQSNIGLTTGIDITGTVDQLMKIEQRPRDLIQSRQVAAKTQQSAVNDLLAQSLALQATIKRFSKATFFANALKVTSGGNDTLSAIATGSTPAAAGSYSFTPVRLAQAQQTTSAGFESKSEALGLTGSLSLQRGGFVDTPRLLETLNEGEGVARGKIRITDRSGSAAVIDLSAVKTIDDVVAAINTNEAVNVQASIEGDRIRLTDNTGETAANLRVQEVSGGTTARDLGLASINNASSTALGNDVFGLYGGLRLDGLRDGNGLDLRANGGDLRIQLRDGSSFDVDFKRVAHPAQAASGRVYAQNGIHADLQFTAKTNGAAYDGVQVVFTSSGTVTQGNETVAYDSNTKTLTFDIAAGQSTADNVIAALANNPATAALFEATRASGSNGTAVVTVNDKAILAGGAAATATNEKTLGDLLATINAVDPTRLKAEIGPDGERIQLVDLTTGARQFTVSSSAGGKLAEQLGVAGSTSGSTLSGKRLASGLKSTLLNSLAGGQGLGTLGDVTITDRAGNSATVQLAGLETLDQVVTAINATGLGVKAGINASHDGLVIRDTTDATTSNLIIANADGTNSATKLKIAASVSANSVDSGSLGKQVVSEQTLLSTYKGGTGITLGSFTITDALGATGAVNLKVRNAQTVGDVIDAINDAGVGVKARVNDEGNGILLYDTTGSSNTFAVTDAGSGTTAKDLKIAGTSVSTTVDSVVRGAINGKATSQIAITGTDTLTTIVAKINDAKAGVTASIVKDPVGASPYRISLTSASGEANRFIVGGSGLPFDFRTTTEGQDALIQVGSGSGSQLITSDSNQVKDPVPGLTLTLKNTSTSSITVAVEQDFETIRGAVQQFVDQFNKLRGKVDDYTAFDSALNKKGALFGTSEGLRIGGDLGRLATGRFNTSGTIQTLEAIGVSVTDAGKLTFDSEKLREKFDADPEEVEKFFTDTKRGFGPRADAVIETIVGKNNSLLVNRSRALQTQIDDFGARLDTWSERLVKKRDRLLKQFYDLETAVSKIQNSFSAVSSSLTNAVNTARSG